MDPYDVLRNLLSQGAPIGNSPVGTSPWQPYGSDPTVEGPKWNEPFPLQVLSGSLSSSGLLNQSWKEILIDGQVGNWSSGPTPRYGVNNLREMNNSGSTAYPFQAMGFYLGQVSGQPYYSYSFGGVGGTSAASPDLDGVFILTSLSKTSTVVSGQGVTSGLYSAHIQQLLSGNTWINSGNAYLLPTNGEVPTFLGRFTGHQVAVESGTGAPIFARSLQDAHQATGGGGSLLSGGGWSTAASYTLPSPGSWLLNAQLDATLSTGASGAGDYVQGRFWDETNSTQPGSTVTFCNPFCPDVTFTDAAPLTAVYSFTSPTSGAVLDVQLSLTSASPSNSGGSTGTIGNVVLTAMRAN